MEERGRAHSQWFIITAPQHTLLCTHHSASPYRRQNLIWRRCLRALVYSNHTMAMAQMQRAGCIIKPQQRLLRHQQLRSVRPAPLRARAQAQQQTEVASAAAATSSQDDTVSDLLVESSSCCLLLAPLHPQHYVQPPDNTPTGFPCAIRCSTPTHPHRSSTNKTNAGAPTRLLSLQHIHQEAAGSGPGAEQGHRGHQHSRDRRRGCSSQDGPRRSGESGEPVRGMCG